MYAGDISERDQRDAVLLDAKVSGNITSMLNKLVFDISFDTFINGLQLKQ